MDKIGEFFVALYTFLIDLLKYLNVIDDEDIKMIDGYAGDGKDLYDAIKD